MYFLFKLLLVLNYMLPHNILKFNFNLYKLFAFTTELRKIYNII